MTDDGHLIESTAGRDLFEDVISRTEINCDSSRNCDGFRTLSACVNSRRLLLYGCHRLTFNGFGSFMRGGNTW